MMYFDNAATTLPKPAQVGQAMYSALQSCGGVGRGGHAAALRAAETVQACRQEAAALFEAEPEQVVLTFNATHGLNLAIASLCSPGMPVVISGYEHNAVTRPLHALRARIEVAGRELFDPQGCCRDFEQALRRGAQLAVCTCCSNVFGYCLPVQELSGLCRRYGVPLILDASQAAGSLPVSLRRSGAAFIAMPGHKGLYGPQGTGLLLCAQGGEPLLYGGTGSLSAMQGMPDDLPDRLEAGTHNVCGIAGLLQGLRYVRRRTPQSILQKEHSLLHRLCRQLEALPRLELLRGAGQSGVLSVRIAQEDCILAAQRLSEHGAAVRAGLHCAPLAHESAGTFPQGTLRISFSDRNTLQQTDRLADLFKKLFR